MFDISTIIDIYPFGLDKSAKTKLYVNAMTSLVKHHYANSINYSNIIDVLGYPKIEYLEDVPFLPIGLFKKIELKSISSESISKIITSSGTCGQEVSRIFLDEKNASDQRKVLIKIISTFTEKKRLPMLVIDSPFVLSNRELFSARGAAILGYSLLGADITYALNKDMELDIDVVNNFLKKYNNQKVLIFGFTFVIWEKFIQALEKNNLNYDIKDGILMHGGGWKKMIDVEVDNPTFKRKIKQILGVNKIYNYYGMAEQTGSVFMECEYGYLHSSIFSDILIRDPFDFKILGKEEKGLIQLLSLLPTSYPGHSILSEDIGLLHGEDDCRCGRLGKYFSVHGRIKKAEIRGCSDVYSS